MRNLAGFFMSAKRSFSKPALSIDEQIALLKRRGLSIPSDNEAKRFLQFVSYYRLSAYTFYYEKKNPDGTRTHRFNDGVTFKDITDLYVFDSKLRKLLWEATELIEIAFRTSLTYHLSLKYGAHWYTDKSLFDSYSYFNHDIFIEKLKKESGYGRHTGNHAHWGGEVFITHYYTNYDAPELPPCWMMTEITPLGSLSLLYSSLVKCADKQLIARDFGLDQKLFTSWIRSLSYMRNLCAHYCRVWNRVYKVNRPAEPKKLKKVGETNIFNPTKIHAFVVICAILLKQINPKSVWEKRVCDLLVEYNLIPKREMGFYDGWENDLNELEKKMFESKSQTMGTTNITPK